ncbi:MAG TPA: MFS transporter [Ideonella sp.]|uniref:MFS transporter n=1 Tax=Ideonella sp. TaxID=1929293 RepID=UPI002B92E4AA|nr:MFS transporter [Ideonella sp.]HSI50346.1 MFS transporter [Ideonella sp.]
MTIPQQSAAPPSHPSARPFRQPWHMQMMPWRTLPSTLLRNAAAVLASRLLVSAAAMMVTPFLVVHLTRELGLAPFVAVLLASAVVIGGRLFARPLGVLVDRRPGIGPAFASLLCCAMATTLLLGLDSAVGTWLAATACICLSVASTTFTLAVRTHVARSFDLRHLPMVYATSSVAFNLGMFVGSALAGWLLHRELGAWAIGCAVGAYLLGACALLVLRSPRSDSSTGPSKTSTSEKSSSSRRSEAKSDTASTLPPIVLGPFAWTYTAIGYLTNTVTLLLAAYCATVFGSAALASVFYSSQSLALVAVLPLMGWLLRRPTLGILATLYFGGQLLAALGFVVFGAIGTAGPAIGVLSVAFCLSQALSVPTADPLLAKLVGRGSVGQVFGTTMSANARGALAACVVNAAALQWLPHERLGLAWVVPGGVALVVVAVAAACRPWRAQAAKETKASTVEADVLQQPSAERSNVGNTIEAAALPRNAAIAAR